MEEPFMRSGRIEKIIKNKKEVIGIQMDMK